MVCPLLLLLLLLLAGCSHSSSSGPARIAVLRFENLTPDVSLDWMGRAASEIISHELAGGKSPVISSAALHANPLAQRRTVSAPGESTERTAAIAEGATRVVIGQISRVGNQLVVDVTERDPAAGKTVSNFTLGSRDANDLYTLADAVARRLSPQVTPFESRNNEAIAAWARALEEADYTKVTEDYSRAVQADPQFASAWLAWSSTAAGHGDRAEAARILAEAQQHANRFSDLNRARLKVATVELTGDRFATLAAINELGRLAPDDPASVGAIADRNFAARQYPAAAAGYRRLTQLIPDNGPAWNQLGYSLLWSGDSDGAMSALRNYQRLFPNDANPIDSQGDVAFAFGRFPEAEKLYEQAAAKNPALANSGSLYKAAAAQLMTGDIAGADKKFQAWATARRAAKDPFIEVRAAQWTFISGKHDQAISTLAKAVSGTSQMQAMLLTQLAIWELQLGHRERALQDADAALKTGAPSGTTLIVRFASEGGSSPADWSARADRALGNPQVAQLKPVALAYALYMARQWEAAAPLWKQLVDRAGADDAITPVVYGEILVELKRPRDAEPYLRLFPLPNPESLQEFLSLAIPKMFDARADLLASQGKTQEAEASRKVFWALWGAP